MKLTSSLVKSQQNHFSCIPPDKEPRREIKNIMKSVISMQNSSDVLHKSSGLKNRSADVIKSF